MEGDPRPASVSYRVADPRDERWDSIECGVSEFAAEEALYFRGRHWTGVGPWPESTCLDVATADGEPLAAVALQVVDRPHPTAEADERAPYLFLYHLCLSPEFQGQTVPASDPAVKWIDEVMALLAELARAESCVGIYLYVRADNERAIRAYARHGFVDDSRYRRRSDRTPMLSMRLVL